MRYGKTKNLEYEQRDDKDKDPAFCEQQFAQQQNDTDVRDDHEKRACKDKLFGVVDKVVEKVFLVARFERFLQPDPGKSPQSQIVQRKEQRATCKNTDRQDRPSDFIHFELPRKKLILNFRF
jgi:hypothetical protein